MFRFLPDIASIGALILGDIPPASVDWTWLSSVQGLYYLHVFFARMDSDSDVEISSDSDDEALAVNQECVQVRDASICFTNATQESVHILQNLPNDLKVKVQLIVNM